MVVDYNATDDDDDHLCMYTTTTLYKYLLGGEETQLFLGSRSSDPRISICVHVLKTWHGTTTPGIALVVKVESVRKIPRSAAA